MPFTFSQIFFILGAHWSRNTISFEGRKKSFWAPMIFSSMMVLAMAFYSCFLTEANFSGDDENGIPTLVILWIVQSGNQFFLGKIFTSALSAISLNFPGLENQARLFFWICAGGLLAGFFL